MNEVDRVTNLHVLAEKGMGWPEYVSSEIHSNATWPRYWIDGYTCWKYLSPNRGAELWEPDVDGGAAFELLAKLGARESDVWKTFCQRLFSMIEKRTGPDLGAERRLLLPGDVMVALASNGPALIAQAAYDALEASHDAD